VSNIRIISGTARGRKLKMVPGNSTRPIPDRVKEALFNILRSDIPGSNFLDLFAGTGSVGIEALSRGAESVFFVDIHRRAVKTIDENLAQTGLGSRAKVLQIDALTLLKRDPIMGFDYIFVAPPQYKGIWLKSIHSLDKSPEWLTNDGWIIVQIDPKEYELVKTNNIDEFDQRRYGNTLLVFYERKQVNHEG
jgi:16S rRNA (guanine(966)-N(2))-methyltransferase RsmD